MSDEPTREMRAEEALLALEPAMGVIDRFADIRDILRAAVRAQKDLANVYAAVSAEAGRLRDLQSTVAAAETQLAEVRSAITQFTALKEGVEKEVADLQRARADAARDH